MALRAVPEHPKFMRLKAILKVGKAEALGLLECVWHFCGRYTPQGDIGKYPDADIEAWCEWSGEEGALIAALVKARWLDRDARHRLVVHDWHKHADDATRLAVKRSGRSFIGADKDADSNLLSLQCPDSVATGSGLPEPEPEPEPEPVPENGRKISPKSAPASPDGGKGSDSSRKPDGGVWGAADCFDLLPESHQTPEMRDALESYDAYRKAKRIKCWVRSTVESQASSMGRYPPEATVAAIRQAIECGWQGFFPEKHVPKAKSHLSWADVPAVAI